MFEFSKFILPTAINQEARSVSNIDMTLGQVACGSYVAGRKTIRVVLGLRNKVRISFRHSYCSAAASSFSECNTPVICLNFGSKIFGQHFTGLHLDAKQISDVVFQCPQSTSSNDKLSNFVQKFQAKVLSNVTLFFRKFHEGTITF